MKAVYWVDDTKKAIVSRPIVGWVTYGHRKPDSTIPIHNFAAVVISDHWFPVLSGFVPRPYCIAPKDVTDEEILAKFPVGGPPAPQGVGGVFH